MVNHVVEGHQPTPAPVDYPTVITERYTALGYGVYQWVHDDSTPPFAPVSKPLSESRVALISSGGVYVVGQQAFHFRDDASFRHVPVDTPTDELRVTHFAYDLTDARRDTNCVLPLRALNDLAHDGAIGSLAPDALSFVGGIYSARRVRESVAPKMVEALKAMHADLALLVPV
jgi:D-proline reductase (dithiol) PrdB